VFVNQCAHRLQFDDKMLIDEKISEEFAQQGAILVQDIERVLLDDGEVLLAQTMGEAVLVNFFNMAVAEMAVQGEAGFADLIAELEYGVFHILGCRMAAKRRIRRKTIPRQVGLFFALSAPLCGQTQSPYFSSRR